MDQAHVQINSLIINTLDPLPDWPRLTQASVGVGRTGTYWCVPRLRQERLAVVKIGIRGFGRVVSRHGEQKVAPGEVMLMRTGLDEMEYGLYEGDSPWHAAYAEIAGELAITALGRLIERHGHVYRPAGNDLLEILTGLADRPGIHQAVWDVSASARSAGCILAAVAHRQESQEGTLVTRTIALFERHLTVHYTQEDAAAELGISRERLGRAFRQALGVPPGTWLRHRRLELARQLLMAADAKVRDVAIQVGYRSVAQFLRAYTARYGNTPGVQRVAS